MNALKWAWGPRLSELLEIWNLSTPGNPDSGGDVQCSCGSCKCCLDVQASNGAPAWEADSEDDDFWDWYDDQLCQPPVEVIALEEAPVEEADRADDCDERRRLRNAQTERRRARRNARRRTDA